MAGRVFVVTGSNTGIGFETVKGLLQKAPSPSSIVLCARSIEKGNEAASQLKELGRPTVAVLDITKKDSIDAFVSFIKEKFGKIDVLINNAGFAFKQSATEPFGEQARVSFDINYYGTYNVTMAVKPLLQSGSKVINVSSFTGKLSNVSEELRKQYTDPSLSIEGLNALSERFIDLAGKGEHIDAGFGKSAYGMSKLSLSAQTRVLAKAWEGENISVNALCPGWCKTNMAGFERPPRTSAQGAETPVFLALNDVGTGKFFSDCKEEEW